MKVVSLIPHRPNSVKDTQTGDIYPTVEDAKDEADYVEFYISG